MAIDATDLDNRFGYHPPKDEKTKAAHEIVRARLRTVAGELTELVPPGREQSLAITALEEAMMWANAGIARAGHISAYTPPPETDTDPELDAGIDAAAEDLEEEAQHYADETPAAGQLPDLADMPEDEIDRPESGVVPDQPSMNEQMTPELLGGSIFDTNGD